TRSPTLTASSNREESVALAGTKRPRLYPEVAHRLGIEHANGPNVRQVTLTEMSKRMSASGRLSRSTVVTTSREPRPYAVDEPSCVVDGLLRGVCWNVLGAVVGLVPKPEQPTHDLAQKAVEAA